MKLLKVVLDAVSRAVYYTVEDFSYLSGFITLYRIIYIIFVDQVTGNDPVKKRNAILLPETVLDIKQCNRKMVKEVNL
jgi:hypothetical protein